MEPLNGMEERFLKYRFEDLEPIKEAEIEIGNLTIIARGNNTRESYLADLKKALKSAFCTTSFLLEAVYERI